MKKTDQTKLRIALLGPSTPFRGGISQFAQMLAAELMRQGHNVKMFSFIKQYPALIFPGSEQTDKSSTSSDLEIAEVLTPYLPWTWSKAVREIQAFSPDLLIVSYWLPFFAPAFAWICSKLKNTRIYFLAHNIQSHEKWPLGSKLRNLALKHADKLIVLSQSCLDDARKLLPLRISRRAVLAFHPIYDSYSRNPGIDIDPNAKTLLFFGLIKPYKGLDVLLKAMPLVLKTIPEAWLIIAGDVYGDSQIYHRLTRELNLEDRVELHLRYISDTEIGSFFQRSQVCILPYKSATQSGVIASSYAFNVPVIASDIGGLGEYIVEGITGYLVPPDDPEALAEQIISYFQAQDFPRMSEEIVKYKASFSWKALAEFILDL